MRNLEMLLFSLAATKKAFLSYQTPSFHDTAVPEMIWRRNVTNNVAMQGLQISRSCFSFKIRYERLIFLLWVECRNPKKFRPLKLDVVNKNFALLYIVAAIPKLQCVMQILWAEIVIEKYLLNESTSRKTLNSLKTNMTASLVQLSSSFHVTLFQPRWWNRHKKMT